MRPARTGAVLAVTCGAQLLVVLDETVVNVALPSIGRDLEYGTASLAWVVDAYMLVFGGFLLLGGRCADLFGRRVVFLAGLAVFVAASLSCGLAQSAEWLTVSRGVQGLGAALLSPAALSILVATFRDAAQRQRVLGIWGGLVGISGVSGVILGGVLTDAGGWRWIFYLNLPVGAVLAAVALTTIPAAQDADRRRVPLDGLGAALVTGGLLLLIYSVIETAHRSWTDPVTVLGLAVAVGCLAAFVVRELRVADPLLRLGMVTHRTVGVANLIMVLAASGLYAVFFFLTLFMQVVHGWSPLRAGLSWAPFGVTMALMSGVALQLLPRLGGRLLLAVGLGIATVGQLMLLRISPGGSYAGQLLPVLLLLAAGYGLSLVPLVNAAVTDVPAGEAGAASGLVNTAQQVGGAVGLAVLATLATGRLDDELAAGTGRQDALVAGFHSAFLVAGVLTALAALLALALPALRVKPDLEAMSGV